MRDIDERTLSTRIAIDASIGSCIAQAAGVLQDGGVDDARVSARRLLAAACNLSPSAILARESEPITAAARERLLEFVHRRLRHEPVSKILGQRSFWKSDFFVSPAVLDPRSDTELLIEIALEELKARRNDPLRILDLGTGSAAILCSLLLEFPHSTGQGVELSPEACAVAIENVRQLRLAERAAIVQCDWTKLPGNDAFDLIVSNPPYIATAAIPNLPPDVRDWDPRAALDGGITGLDAYRDIAPVILERLAVNGLGLLEIGFDQAESVPEVMVRSGLTVEAVRRDLGGHPRVVVVKK